MRPYAWLGARLVCEGGDGRVYIKRRSPSWLGRWMHRKLPRIDHDGKVIGKGPGCR